MKILLLQLKRIGDLVLTTPAIAAVRAQFPHAQISLAVASGCAPLLPAIAGIDRAFVVRGNVKDAAKWLAVAAGRFEFCVDFTHNDRSAFLTLLSGARKRITAAHVERQSKLRAKSYNVLVPAKSRALHTVETQLALLEPLGIHEAPAAMQLTLPASARSAAVALLEREKIRGDYVLIHPGSARAEKFWEPDRWARVIEFAAAELRLPCVVTGTASGAELAHIEAIKAATTAPIVDLAGRTDLLTLAALVERARMLVAVDSAAMHFAAAFHTPQIALFGPTNPFHWRPRDSAALIFQGITDTPVTEFIPKQKREPMSLISTGAVIGGMQTLLSASAAPRHE